MGNYLFIQLLKTYFFVMPGLWRNTVCQTESTSTCIIRTPVILAWRQIVSTLTQTRTNFINRSGRGRLSTTCSGGLSRDWTSVVISDQFSSGDGGGGGFGGGGTALEQPIGKVTVSTSNFVRCSTVYMSHKSRREHVRLRIAHRVRGWRLRVEQSAKHRVA